MLGGGFTEETCLKIRHTIVEFPLEYSWLLSLKGFLQIVELRLLISSRYLGFSFLPANPTLQYIILSVGNENNCDFLFSLLTRSTKNRILEYTSIVTL